jgi:hypothetical protein
VAPTGRVKSRATRSRKELKLMRLLAVAVGVGTLLTPLRYQRGWSKDSSDFSCARRVVWIRG